MSPRGLGNPTCVCQGILRAPRVGWGSQGPIQHRGPLSATLPHHEGTYHVGLRGPDVELSPPPLIHTPGSQRWLSPALRGMRKGGPGSAPSAALRRGGGRALPAPSALL